MTTKKLLFCWILLVVPITAVESKSDGLGEWRILTTQNFSSQIRLHPHIILIVTLPWSGESRTLMKDVTRLVTDRKEEFSSVKLMFIYRNTEKTVADAIGATSDTEETTVLYYHHSVSYKYRGRLRAQNVLASLRPYVAVAPEELPVKSLKTPEELKAFVDSTDKALILVEFCDWTPKLLANRKMNGTGLNGFGLQGDLLRFNSSAETHRTPAHLGKNNQKGIETGKIKCDVDYGLGGVPWLGGFSPVNDGASFEESEEMSPGVGPFCTRDEYQQFDSFFSKFMTVAQEFFLPPERHRFGLVSERSMLSTLGIGDSSSWLAVLYFSGCPGCLKIIKKEDELKNALQMDNLVVTELEGDGKSLEPALPANQPSVLLFVDRSSDLSETRMKCKEALDAFRELALHHHISYQVGALNRDKSQRSSVQNYQASRSTSGHPRLKLSQTAQMIKLKDKVSSFMIVNEGKQVTLDKITLDVQGSSLKEILDSVLTQKKKAKLSLLAKELGFQLLSDDIDIKLVTTLPVQKEIRSDQQTQELSKEGLVTGSVELDKDQLPHKIGISAEEHLETFEVTDSDIPSQNDEEKAYVDTSKQFLSVDIEQHLADHKLDISEDLKVGEASSSQVHMSEGQQHHSQRFEGSFFFSDGNYRLLRALTGGSKIPALVLVDPIAQQHYVFSEETNLSYSSLADFLDGFVNGSLLPYQQSESVLLSSRQATQPPFVNLDFHQVDSVPRVTSHTFSELVIGFNQSDTDAWSKDVLVLFSNRWCGFCQRMELVVREVYRAMKDYIKMLKNGVENEKTMFHDDDLKDEMQKFPLIYLLDCTLNDCSLILKSMNQSEVYPALVLFPAEKKNALSYEGDMAVTEIFKFMADHGSNSHHLISEKGILWTLAKRGGGNQNVFKVQPSEIHAEAPIEKDTVHEVLLTKTHKQVIGDNQAKSHTSQGLHEAALRVVTGSILVATDKLLSVHPFDKSEILIVKADQVTGFQGLIFNKHISWDAVHELEKGLEMLVEAPLSFGGPLMKGGMPLVALTRRFDKEYSEVLPGVFFLDQLATVHKIKELKLGNQSVSDYWFFFGYSSWGWDQLYDEIAEGAWNLSDDGLKHLDWPSG